MNSDIRDRRIRLMQAKDVEALTAKLTSFEVFGPVQWSDLPDWIAPQLAETRWNDAVPDARLPERASESSVRQWIRSFLSSAVIGDRFFLVTGIEHFPWLDVCPLDDRWLDNLLDVNGYELTIVSASKDVLVVFYAEEHEYQAFRREAVV